jgi:hypothetical protein
MAVGFRFAVEKRTAGAVNTIHAPAGGEGSENSGQLLHLP